MAFLRQAPFRSSGLPGGPAFAPGNRVSSWPGFPWQAIIIVARRLPEAADAHALRQSAIAGYQHFATPTGASYSPLLERWQRYPVRAFTNPFQTPFVSRFNAVSGG
jgi:hypothetical protein